MSAATDLFGNQVPRKSATFSTCGLFRYVLTRIWDDRLPILDIVMLNPSTADASNDDPTVLALIHFAKLWGYGGIRIGNVHAFCASRPAALFAAAAEGKDIDGPQNANILGFTLLEAKREELPVLVAWGNDGDRFGGASRFVARAEELGVRLICLGTTQSGAPKHPMARGQHRIPRDQLPIRWRAAA